MLVRSRAHRVFRTDAAVVRAGAAHRTRLADLFVLLNGQAFNIHGELQPDDGALEFRSMTSSSISLADRVIVLENAASVRIAGARRRCRAHTEKTGFLAHRKTGGRAQLAHCTA
jgi:hypothetical protein